MSKSTSLEPVEVLVEPVFAIQSEHSCSTDPNEIGAAMGAAFGAIHGFAAAHHLSFTGPPRAIYHEYGGGQTRFTVAIPIGAPPDQVQGEHACDVGTIPGGRTLRFTHTGSYSELKKTYDAITEWMKDEGLIHTEADWRKYSPMWEEYMNDPESTPESELLTYIYVPLG